MTRKKKLQKAESSYHHGDLSTALINAGLSLLKEKGVEGVSLRAVATLAGVSHSAPYRHYKNKTALLAAIALRGFDQLCEAVQQVMREWPNDPKKQLIESGKSYVRLAVANPEMAQLMFGGLLKPEDLDEEYCKHSQQAFQALLQVLQNGEDKNLYKPVSNMQRALATWSMVHGLAMLASAGQLGPNVEDEEHLLQLTEYVATVILDGILEN